MAEKLTIVQMKKLISHLEEVKEMDEPIPQSYVDRLERSAQLLNELKGLPKVNWDELFTIEDVERAEALIYQKLELKNDVEKHLHTCGLTPKAKTKAHETRQRAPRRGKEQIEYDRKRAEIFAAKRKDLNIPFGRGVRLTDEDRKRLEDAVEKELKKQKVVAPKA